MFDKNNEKSIEKLFDEISKDYDKLNNIMSFGMHKIIKQIAVTRLPNTTNGLIADLCTGTGDIAILLSNRFTDSQINAYDFSEEMLKIAKTNTSGIKNINIIKADVNKLPLDDNSINICFISFGLRNLKDIEGAIKEIRRVLKPNGTLSILDLGEVTPFFKPFFNFYFFNLIPLFGKLFHKNKEPYSYLAQSKTTYPVPTEIIKKLEENGFSNCKNYNYAFGAISQQIATKK